MDSKTNKEDLIDLVESLKNGMIGGKINSRILEFEEIGSSSKDEIFKELCFCLLTANFDAARAIKIQKEINNDFLTLDQECLAERLRNLGYRFPNKRAEYIFIAQGKKTEIESIMNSIKDEKELRNSLAKNVKGLGFKEASHFLRNIGYKNCAIIDFHIIDILERYGFIEKPKTLSKKKYMEIEKILEDFSENIEINLADLDLYLWFLETGKILK